MCDIAMLTKAKRDIASKGGHASSGSFGPGDPRAKEAGRKGGHAGHHEGHHEAHDEGEQPEE